MNRRRQSTLLPFELPASRRRGMVLIVVMIVIVIVSLAGFAFAALMFTERKAVQLCGDDLQLDLSGANGSVTVEDWFSRREERVELVQFSDGFAWDEDDIAQLARRSRFGGGDRLGREGGADAWEIARQWAAVKRHADALALAPDDLDEAGDWQPVSMGAFVDARRRRSAFEAAQATEGFRSLEAQ